MSKTSFLPLLILCISCGKEGNSTSSKEDAPKAVSGQAKGTFEIEVVESSHHSSFESPTPIKALPNRAFACVRFKVSNTEKKLVVPVVNLRVADGKEIHRQQHASAGFANDTFPKQGIAATLEAGVPSSFSLCYEVKESDLGQPMSLIMPSGEKADFTITKH